PADRPMRRYLELQPSNPSALATLAGTEQLLLADGVQDRAARAEQAVARAEPKDVNLPERHQARALAMIRAGRPVDAETYLRPLGERYPAYWELWDALGLAQRAAAKLADAKARL